MVIVKTSSQQLKPNRHRRIYLLILGVVIIAGLGSRKFGAYLPTVIATYAGDTLWALMVFVGLGLLRPRLSIGTVAGLALGFAFCIEVSQLYHAPWIDGIRATTLGALVLGHGFLWSDLVCYTVGIMVGAGTEMWFNRLSGNGTSTRSPQPSVNID